MRTLVGIVIALLVVGVAVAAFVYSGAYNIGADAKHNAVIERLIAAARDASIANRANGLEVPPDLDAEDRIRRGAGNYAAMCAGCHLEPGRTTSELRSGLYPAPPDLTQPPAVPDAAARRFWIIKHGIKGSGMPAWSNAGVDDAAIWDLVALLQRLPALTAADYAALVEASEGHSHHGVEPHHHHDDD